MADISKDELRKEITAILKDADLSSITAKHVRQQIEEKLDVDLTERKKEVDELVMGCLQEKQESPKKAGKKGKADAKDESEDGEQEDEEEEEEEEEASEEEKKKPAKRGPKKGAPKRKKASSEEDESASNEDVSDEEYSPKKKPKKGKPGKKGRKSKGGSEDSDDSDDDWGKNKKKSTGGAKKAGGGGGKGKGYTRPYKLSADLAAIVGAKEMPRHEVVKKVWAIIKERDLYDPKNKQFAICDEDLLKVIGVKRFRTFGMMKYLKNHFVE